MSKQKAREPQLVSISVSQLVPAANIRHDVMRADIDQMKASVLKKGVLQNLIAAPRSDGKHAVFAGGTRLLAVQELVASGDLPGDTEVNCLVFHGIDPEGPEAIEIAMSENMIRTQMDYVDECAAMLQLARAKKAEEEIAAIFGYAPRTVHERLLIASLVPEAHAMVRSKARTLAWARALTLADATMQKQICDDIASNPEAWATGDDVRKFLTKSTIDAANALFDLETYTGEVVTDMFEGDKLADISAFWTLQNEAIEALKIEIEAEGYLEVVVTREPFAAWQFNDETDPTKSFAFIEVLPSGAVNVIRGKVPIEEMGTKITALDAADVEAANVFDEIADHEVRATPSMVEYAVANRSAMVQAKVAGSFRDAMEYTVIAMIGHRNASFAAQVYSMPGKVEARSSNAFAAMMDFAHEVDELTRVEAATHDDREMHLVAMVRSMSDEDLHRLFAMLVGQRVGQQKRRGVDDSANSLMNAFGSDIDVREWWTPDESFFELMASEDLRRLATHLLSGVGSKAHRFASAKRKDLVRTLASNFRDARDGVLVGEIGRSLNAWVPGIMSFPAQIAMKSEDDVIFEDDADLDALLFGEEDAA